MKICQIITNQMPLIRELINLKGNQSDNSGNNQSQDNQSESAEPEQELNKGGSSSPLSAAGL